MIGIIFVSFLISGTERDRRIWACSRSDCKDKKKVAVDGGPSCQSLGSSSPVSRADADYCSTAGVRTDEIRRLTEWWHARTLASYYKSGWSNELIFFLPLKYYKFLSFHSTYLFIFFINLHALYLIMKKKSLPLILLVAVRTRPDILDGMRKLWFILTTCPQQCSSGWKSLAEERRKKLWKRGFLHDSVFLFSIFI